MVADRAAYERLLAACRESWEQTGDPKSFEAALDWVFLHRQRLPSWLAQAGHQARRSDEQEQQYFFETQHRVRWAAVKHFLDQGLAWPAARDAASDQLEGTAASGSSATMKRSYDAFERILRASPARRALIGAGRGQAAARVTVRASKLS